MTDTALRDRLTQRVQKWRRRAWTIARNAEAEGYVTAHPEILSQCCVELEADLAAVPPLEQADRCSWRTPVFGRCSLNAGHAGLHINSLQEPFAGLVHEGVESVLQRIVQAAHRHSDEPRSYEQQLVPTALIEEAEALLDSWVVAVPPEPEGKP